MTRSGLMDIYLILTKYTNTGIALIFKNFFQQISSGYAGAGPKLIPVDNTMNLEIQAL